MKAIISTLLHLVNLDRVQVTVVLTPPIEDSLEDTVTADLLVEEAPTEVTVPLQVVLSEDLLQKVLPLQ